MAQTQHIIEGTLFWNHIAAKSPDSGKYEVSVGFLTDESVALLTDLGVSVKVKKDDAKVDQGQYVTCKSNFPIKAKFLKASDEIDIATLGNGSKIKVKGTPYPWTYQSKKGINFGANAVLVLEAVEYIHGDDGDWGDDVDLSEATTATSSDEESPFQDFDD